MEWKRFDNETPTEKGLYLLADGDFVQEDTYDLEEILMVYRQFRYTHYLLIQPPKGEK